MPGRKGGEYTWNYVTRAEVYRTVPGNDSLTPEGVEAVSPFVDRTDVQTAYDSQLVIAAITSATTSYSLVIFVDPQVSGATGPTRWCRWKTIENLEGSIIHTIRDVPAGTVKVLLTDHSGDDVLIATAMSL